MKKPKSPKSQALGIWAFYSILNDLHRIWSYPKRFFWIDSKNDTFREANYQYKFFSKNIKLKMQKY